MAAAFGKVRLTSGLAASLCSRSRTPSPESKAILDQLMHRRRLHKPQDLTCVSAPRPGGAIPSRNKGMFHIFSHRQTQSQKRQKGKLLRQGQVREDWEELYLQLQTRLQQDDPHLLLGTKELREHSFLSERSVHAVPGARVAPLPMQRSCTGGDDWAR